MKPLPLAVSILLVFISAGTLAAQWETDSEPNAGLDDSIYRFLDRLEAAGLSVKYIAGISPVSRSEIARILIEAEETARKRPGLSSDSMDEEIRYYMRKYGFSVAARGGFGPPARADFSLLYGNIGQPRNTAKPEVFFTPCDSISIRTTALDGAFPREGLQGRRVEDGVQEFSGISCNARLVSFLCFHAAPEIRLGHDHDPGENAFDVEWRDTYVKLSVLGLELEAGWQNLRWGPGRHDGVILTRNAAPLPLVRITPTSPFRLPWIFSLIGDIKFDLFVSRLEKDRHIPRPFFAGLKVSFRPLPWIELGTVRTVMFGGDGRPPVDADMLWKIWWGRYDNPHGGEEDLSNQLAGFDGSIRINLFGVGFNVYGEAVGEDETNMFPYKWSTVLGILITGLPPGKSFDFRLEWAHTHRVAYAHGTYRTGYRYRGMPLGHHVGRDGRDIYAEIAFRPAAAVSLAVFADWEARREMGSFMPMEEHIEAGARLSLLDFPSAGVSITAEYRFRRVRNEGYVRGEYVREHFLDLSIIFAP